MWSNQHGVLWVICNFQASCVSSVFSFQDIWCENYQQDIGWIFRPFSIGLKAFHDPRPTNELQRRHVQPRFCPGKWKGFRHIPSWKYWFQGHVHCKTMLYVFLKTDCFHSKYLYYIDVQYFDIFGGYIAIYIYIHHISMYVNIITCVCINIYIYICIYIYNDMCIYIYISLISQYMTKSTVEFA